MNPRRIAADLRRTGAVALFGFLLLLLLLTGAAQAQDASELTEGFATVEGLKIHYLRGGSGPPLILLHGFTLTGEQWEPFVPELAQRFTLIIPDLPGHGASDRLPSPFSCQRTADLMFGLLDQLGIRRVRGIGHSAGAVTLLHMAARQPERLEAMALVAGAHRLALAGREELAGLSYAAQDDDSRDLYLRLHPGGQSQAEFLFQELNSLADNYRDFSFSPEYLATLKTPTLLMWGDRDPYFPLEFALEMYRAIPAALLWVVPGQGHNFLWPAWGGSPVAASIFPKMVSDFFMADTQK